jgi:hypothetical protein
MLLQSVAGIVVVVGAYFTWRQVQIARRQLLHTIDMSNAQMALSVRSQVTEQMSRCIEQLGHAKAGVRAGAVYALEQLARTSDEARPGIYELLATHIRAEAVWAHHDPHTFVAIEPPPATASDSEPEIPLLKVRAPDIQAALTALGRRVVTPDQVVELQSVDLRACYLGDANFSGAFFGRAMLAYSDLAGANMSGAWLRRVNLRNSVLVRCNLQNANLQDVILSGAEMAEANLCGSNLANADLSLASLAGAQCNSATTWPANFDWRSAGVIERTAEPQA